MISVIVPIYNAQDYLRRCLDSIVNQTYKDIEILLIDDGSTDNSRAICHEYAKRDTRIDVIHKLNAGTSAARNTGIYLSKGDFITFVDADDFLELDAIETFIDYCWLGVDLVMGDFFISNKPPDYILNYTKILYEADIADYLQSYLKRPSGHALFVYCWANLYKASIIKENNIRFNTDMHIFEDGIFNMKYLKHVKLAGYVRKHIYHYVINDHQTAERWIFKEPLAFKNIISAVCMYLRSANYIENASTSFAIKQMIRYFSLGGEREEIKQAINTIINDYGIQTCLRYYQRSKGDSWLIPFLMKRKWIDAIMWACKRRAG